MSLFEYVAVAASLVCSFAAIRLLGGVAAVIPRNGRYWVHTTWVFMIIFFISIQWWFFWSYRDIEWDYGRFMIALLPLGIVYVISTLLIPADTAQVRSWRIHFFEIRVRFYALGLGFIAATILNTVVLLDHPVFHSRRIIPGTFGAILVAGLLSEHPKLHAVIVLAMAAWAAVMAVVFMRPGSFGVAP